MKQLLAGIVIGSAITVATGLLLGAGPDVEKAEAPIGRFQIAIDRGSVWVVDTTTGYVSVGGQPDQWTGLGTPVPSKR